jgi:hypothetical protein
MTPRTPGAVRLAGRALRAEWTKLRSVRSTSLALLAVVTFTLLLTTVAASAGNSDLNDGPLTVDQFHFVHQPMAGDGTVTARVTAQTDTGAWAKAGIMLKAGAASGSPYVALMVTPQHGVLLQADASTELTRTVTGLPRWLRLTRSGQTVTGYESADGSSWRQVGTVTAADLPAQVRAGLFVASPPSLTVNEMGPGSSSFERTATLGEAVFDHVAVGTATAAAASAWQNTDVTRPPPSRADMDKSPGGLPYVKILPGSARDSGGTITVKGSGDIGRVGMGGISLTDTDTVKESLVGVRIGLIAAVALGVLYMTSEFKTRTIGTTFAASPRRAYVLAAKAMILTGVVFLAGLAASVAAFFIAQPLQHRNGYKPPVYPAASVTDPVVVRAIVGTALALALIALFSLAVGTILRRTAGAVIVIFTLLVVIPTVVAKTSTSANTWIGRATPIAGLAIQQTMDFPGSDVVIGPWTGFAVLAGYTAVALAVAFWLLNRRDA